MEFSKEILKGAESSIESLKVINNTLVKDIQTKLAKTNNDTEGLIMWLNPGVSRDICPEPIHLRDTIRHFTLYPEYQSTGYDSSDLIALSDSNQYRRIKEWMEIMRRSQKDKVAPVLPRDLKTIDIENFKLKVVEFKFLETAEINLTTKATKLENSMKEVIATAVKILKDVSSNKIKSPDCAGNILLLFLIITSQMICNFMYFMAQNTITDPNGIWQYQS